MRLVFKGGTVGIAGHCVVTGDIGNAVSIHYTLYLAIIANLAGERFSSLLGVGLVFSAVTSEGIESFIAQVGGGVVLSIGIGCDTLDARFCLFNNGFIILAGNYRARFAGSLGSHVGLIPIFYGIDHAVLLVCPLAHGAFCIHRRTVPGIRKFLTDAVGSNGTLADRIIIFRPCIAAVFIEGRCTGLGFPRHRIHLPIHGLRLAAINGSVVIFCIQCAGECLGIKGSGNGQVRHTGDCACGSDVHIADFAGCCCDFALCINGKVSSRPFDGAVPFQSCASMFIIIATGIEPVFVHDSTIQAHFDAIFVHGNLIITIYLQYQLIHSSGCGAVVADFGNHAVVAHFEVILVGRFASSFFSCHCLSIGLDLRIQVSKSFVCCFAYLYNCLSILCDKLIQGG